MKKTIIIACLLMTSGCFHSQSARENGQRLKKRADAFLTAREAETNLDLIYYKENVVDADLNLKELGMPSKNVNIHDHEAVASSQKKLLKQQEAKGILKVLGFNIFTGLAGLLGFGGVVLKVKSAFNKVKSFGKAASERAEQFTALHGSMIKGVDKYKNQFEDVISKLPLDESLRDKIIASIGKEKLYALLGAEATKTGHGSIHHKFVEEVKKGIS